MRSRAETRPVWAPTHTDVPTSWLCSHLCGQSVFPSVWSACVPICVVSQRRKQQVSWGCEGNRGLLLSSCGPFQGVDPSIVTYIFTKLSPPPNLFLIG